MVKSYYQSNYPNDYINFDRSVQDVRGVSAIKVDPKYYTGDESGYFRVIREDWMLDRFWLNNIIVLVSISLGTIFIYYMTAVSPNEFNRKDHNNFELMLVSFYHMIDFAKDMSYTFWFPHANRLVLFL